MEEILLTKLMPPEFGTWLLPRERLLGSIIHKESSPRILEVTAPAGYGKTVFTQQLSRRLNKPLIWIQLDRYDNDPAIFLRYLVEGLRQYWPGLGEKVLQLSAKGDAAGSNPRLISSLLANELVRAGAGPLLVLDDSHELIEPNVHALLQELLKSFPSGVSSIISGRTSLPLNLYSLLIQGAARQIGPAELSFTRDEIAALLVDRFGPQPRETVEEIEKITGGWPVALELLEEQLPGQGLNYKIHNTSSLYDYLAEEVLNKQLRDYQEFLLESAVLDILTPRHCDELMERENSAAVLEILAKKQKLVIPLEGKGKAYRLHQLFKEFLLHHLGVRRPLLQRRAGRHALLGGDAETAVEYFLQAGFDAEAEKAMEDAGRKALAEGRWHTVVLWLEQLRDEQIRGNPWLSYFRAVVEIFRGRLYEAEGWVEGAAAAFAAIKVDAGLMECHLLQARLLRTRGRYPESLAMLEQAVALNELEASRRFDLILEKGYNLFLSGKLQEAERFLTEALKPIKKSGNMQAAAYVTEALGNICYQQGKHARALQLYRWCQEVSAEGSLSGYYILDALPYIYCDWGELDKALDLAHNYVAAQERYQMVESLPSAYSTLAYVYFELGDYEKVEELVRKALELHHQHGEERFFLLLNQMVLAWCRLAGGHWVEARQILDNTLSEAEEQVDQVCSMIQMLAGTALALMGNLSEAGDILRKAEANLEAMNFRIRLCDAYKALAYISFTLEDRKSFQKYARKFLQLGARMNYVCNRLHFTFQLLEPVLRFGLEQGVEVLYVQCMLSRLGPNSHNLLLELAKHPSPVVRQRIIAPLTELADESMVQALKELSEDSVPEVRQSARAYKRFKLVSFEAGIPLPALNQADGLTLEVKTLGMLRLFIDGNEIAGWRTRKTRELMALLIHLGEPAGKDRLREELWPDVDPRNSNALFGTTMYYLRRCLKQAGLAGLIQYRQGRYSLKAGACTMDCSSFEALITAGLQQEPLQEMGAGLLGKAVRLYRGDYLANPGDYTWALPRQVRLKHLYIEGLLALARYWFSRKNYSRAQTYLLQLKEADPFCEPAHRLLLQIHANMGRHQSLVEDHRSFTLMLMEETGLPPARETETLFRRLLNEA